MAADGAIVIEKQAAKGSILREGAPYESHIGCLHPAGIENEEMKCGATASFLEFWQLVWRPC